MQVSKPKKGFKSVIWLFKKELQIPNNWNLISINEISTIHSGIWGDDPLPKKKTYPIIRSTDITHDNRIDISNVAHRIIDSDKLEKYFLKTGDLLIVASSGSSRLIGRTALFEEFDHGTDYLFSNFLLRLHPKNTVPEYLFYLLNSYAYRYFLNTYQTTTTGLRNFPKKDFLKFQFSMPPLSEQKQIASKLSNVDNLIGSYRKSIETTKKLKKGIMQKLLIKGIGHTKFKKVEWLFGKEIKIPSAWKILSLKDVSKKGLQNGVFKKPSEFGSGISLVNVFNLYSEMKIDLTNLDRVQVSDSELDKYRVYEGDIFFDRSSLVLEGIGHSNIILGMSEPTVFECHVMRLSPNKLILPKFLFYYTQTNLFKQFIMSIAKTVTMTTITQPDLEKAQILIPPFPEQKQIVSILSNVDSQITKEKLQQSNLEILKKGLMQKLLTGQIRVKF